MRSRLLCFTFVLFFTALLSNRALLFAEESASALSSVDQTLTILEAKLNRISEVQTQIIQKQAEIKQDLSNLRIWIRRNPR